MSEYNQYNPDPLPPEATPEKKNNRPVMAVLSVLGLIIILSLAVMIFFFLLSPTSVKDLQGQTPTTLNAQETALQSAAEQTAEAIICQQTRDQAMMLTEAALPTDTPVPAETSAEISAGATTEATAGGDKGPISDGTLRTQTVAALLTQAAQGTPVAESTQEITNTQSAQPTATALPDSGFADDVGLPGLFGVGILLLVAIFGIRRLRLNMR